MQTYTEYLTKTYTIPQLREIASQMGLELSSRAKKTDIVAEIDQEITDLHIESLRTDWREDALSEQISTWYGRHNLFVKESITAEDVLEARDKDHEEALAMDFHKDVVTKNARRVNGYKNQASKRSNKVANIMVEGVEPKRSRVFTNRQNRRMKKVANKAQKTWRKLMGIEGN